MEVPKNCMLRKPLDLEAMANNLKNVELIHFGKAYVDQIMPFVRRAKNLGNIKIGIVRKNRD